MRHKLNRSEPYARACGFVLVLPFFIFTFGCTHDRDSQLRFVSTLAGSNGEIGEPFGAVSIGNETYMSDGEAGKIFKVTSDGILSEFASGLHTPSGLAVGDQGEILVADSGSNTVVAIGRSGEIKVVAGTENQVGSEDGTALAATFRGPVGIATAVGGRIFVTDTYNDRIRVIENGAVRTLAGGTRGFRDGIGTGALFDTPLGLAVWKDRLLVADSGNRRIRVVEYDGTVWTLAGTGEAHLRDGRLLSAGFAEPTAISVDPLGNIYIADLNAIRRTGGTAFPMVTTVAGGKRGFRNGRERNSEFNRISGLAFNEKGDLLAADSENRLLRMISSKQLTSKTEPVGTPKTTTAEEFRKLQPARWPFDPPNVKRDIAGTLGEIRGEIVDANSQVWFHNGLDIAGAYGETARFVRNEKVLDPNSAENFATLRELIRMPTLGYIHLRLGRDKDDKPFGDQRFIFDTDETGKIAGVRVPRGAKFSAGEPIGTLNAMNHVHLIAGRSGAEMNALAALELPGISDSISPSIEDVAILTEASAPVETKAPPSRIKLRGKYRIVVRAFDRMDGNPDRRRLGVYKLGFLVLPEGSKSEPEPDWRIIFDRMPSNELVKLAYGSGSHSGATGETIFMYIVTNRISGDRGDVDYLNTAEFSAGNYTLKVFAADFFGNVSQKAIPIEVIK